jgi:hypothetical protein
MSWLTDKSPILQSDIPNKIETLHNQIYYHKGNAYLIPRGLVSDNYTIPLGINKSKWDVRASHLHDIACKYHQVILINLSLPTIIDNYLEDITIDDKDITICKDIPKEYLSTMEVSFNKANNLLKDAMVSSGIPTRYCKLYRFAVNFNLNWLFTGKDKIDLNKLYKDNIIT